jgi:hypothetical protein
MRALAQRIARLLAEIEGVQAVVLGGSWARGTASPDSDLDLGIYYQPSAPPSVRELRRLAAALDPGRSAAQVTNFGDWGPWVNGGAWLDVEGRQVDWIYRDLDKVAQVIDDCVGGRPTCDYYLGHPHGFHNHVYLAEVHHCQPLHDPNGIVEALKSRVTPYPPALRQALIEKYLFDAAFMLDLGRKPAGRGDVFHVAGCLFRCAAALVQVLFALNERYFMNEKGAVAAIETFPRHPPSFASRVGAILGNPGGDAGSLCRSVAEMDSVLAETRDLAPALAYSWSGR